MNRRIGSLLRSTVISRHELKLRSFFLFQSVYNHPAQSHGLMNGATSCSDGRTSAPTSQRPQAEPIRTPAPDHTEDEKFRRTIRSAPLEVVLPELIFES